MRRERLPTKKTYPLNISYRTDYGGRLCKLSEVKIDAEAGYEEVIQIILCSMCSTIHNLEMHTAYKKLREHGITCWSVKTDAFVINNDELEKAKEIFEFHGGIGGWRADKHNEEIKTPTVQHEVVRNERAEIPTFERKELHIKDEYDTHNTIEEHIVPSKHVIIRGDAPGTGKSYICQRMVEKGYNVIFVCPTNKLLQSFEGEAVAVHKCFFCIGFGTVKFDEFAVSEFDLIVFDEVYFSCLHVYSKMKQLVQRNQEKIINATGDCSQYKN